MTTIPDGWTWRSLSQIATLGSGGTPTARQAEYYGGPIPWAVIGDLNDGVVRETRLSITDAGLANSSAKMVPTGTILLAMYGSIGKLGIAGQAMATNQAIASIVPGPAVDDKFLFHYLRHQRTLLDAQGKGATQRNISQTILKPWVIPTPPLAEQRRIVEILEGHLSHLDAANHITITSTRRIRAARDALILRAVTGGGSRIHGATPDLAPIGTNDGDLPALPIEWTWQRLGEIAEVVGGVTKDSKKQGDPSLIEVPYLRVANVQRGELRLDSVTSIRVPPARASKLALESGDVLLNEGGDKDKLARGWVWEDQIANCIHQNHVFRARVQTDLDPYFLSHTANSLGGRWAERNGKQSVNLASISLTMIRKMPVAIPPRGASRHIVERLHDQLSGLDRLSLDVATVKLRTDVLRRAVLAAAFSGKLTGGHTDQEVIEELAQ